MKTAETVINDRQYKILLPAVTKRMLLANRLSVQIGGVLGTLGMEKNKGMELFGDALRNIDPDKLLALMTNAVALSNLSCNGKPAGTEIDFERHFNEFPEDVYQACFWCLWECTRDFLPRSLKDSAQGARAKFAEEFQSLMAGK